MNKLDAMRYAGEVNLKAIQTGIAVAIPGVTLQFVDEAIERVILGEGCEAPFKGYHGFPNVACLSPNDVLVHGIPNEYKLRANDILTIDVGTKYQGYCVDAARTIIVPQEDSWHPLENEGRDASRVKLMVAADAILGAQMGVVKAGATLMDIVDAATRTADELGVRVIHEYGGHQIGKVIHEELDGYDGTFIPNVLDPRKTGLSSQIQQRRLAGYHLKEGQTICLEPVVTFGSGDIMIDEDGWTVRTTDGADAAHSERCLIVTKDGYELLS